MAALSSLRAIPVECGELQDGRSSQIQGRAAISRRLRSRVHFRSWQKRRISIPLRCYLKSDDDPATDEQKRRSRFWQDTAAGRLIGPIIHKLNGSSSRATQLEAKLEEFSSEEEQRNNSLELLHWPRKLVEVLSGTSPVFTQSQDDAFKKALWRAEDDLKKLMDNLWKGTFVLGATGTVLGTGLLLSDGDYRLESNLVFSWLAGLVIGLMVGSNQVLESQAKPGPLNLVITGSTRGLGKALAREFLRAGDNVVVASRSAEAVAATIKELQDEVQGLKNSVRRRRSGQLPGKVIGMPCDVSSSKDVQALASFALEQLGSIDIWINNAGVNKGFKPLLEVTDGEMQQIVSTNLIGSMVCTREAIRIMEKQPKKSHIFNMDGAGSNGAGTPLTAVYGASKSGLRQLHESLRKELKGSRVGLHTASPGMVLTDLLLSGASLHNKKMFNMICEQPETVARDLVPKIRMVKGTGKSIEYLTPPRIVLAIITAWLRRGRWFDEEGRAVYAAEADRLRAWAEERQRSNFAEAVEMIPSGAWVSLLSSSAICAYIILTNGDGKLPM